VRELNTVNGAQEIERQQRLFESALLRPESARSAFLDEACAGEGELRARLEAMLAAHGRCGLLLDHTPLGMTTAAESGAAAEAQQQALPQRIGAYRVVGLIGCGGMGAVYEAEQEQPRRKVAVKVLALSIASRQAMRRFEYESQLLSRLRHPGIAQVYDAGTHVENGRKVPYFVMEHVPGALPITRFAREKRLDVRQRIELFAQVCEAVHHGHEKGVIHRDLKPSNILVDAEGHPRLIDFGVARATDSDTAAATLQTHAGQMIGTLQYMSPEQCAADASGVDVRSDIYSLGVVLYELLCDRLPYDLSGQTLYEAMRRVRDEEPAKGAAGHPAVRGDVGTIIFKAMEKDRERRYRSAAEFADDLRCYLSGDTILARRPTRTYLLRVFVRRNKALVAAVAAIILALALGVVGTGIGLARARVATNEAEQKAREARAFVNYVKLSFAMARPDPALNGVDLRISDFLDRMGRETGAALAGHPEAEIEVRMMLAKAYTVAFAYQEYERPAKHFGRALELSRSLPGGGESERTLRLAAEYALPLAYLDGRAAEARRIASWAHDAAARVLGQTHPVTQRAAHAHGMAILVADEGDAAKAASVMRPVFEQVMGQDPQATGAEAYALAADLALLVRQNLLDPALAESLARRAIERIDAYPRPEVAVYRSRLTRQISAARWQQGDPAGAVAYASEAWEHGQRWMGRFHPETLMRLCNWAEAMAHAGKGDEARAAVKAEIAAARGVLRADDQLLVLLRRFVEEGRR
jgi:eukaryotic-like serine/threonine-protein kinase